MFRFLFYCFYRGMQKVPLLNGSNESSSYVDKAIQAMYASIFITVNCFSPIIGEYMNITVDQRIISLVIVLIFVVPQGYYFIQRGDRWKYILRDYDAKPRWYVYGRLVVTCSLPLILASKFNIIFYVLLFYGVLTVFYILLWWGSWAVLQSRGGFDYKLRAAQMNRENAEKIDDNNS